jgi:uncharacterized damage-inducible protein DinB
MSEVSILLDQCAVSRHRTLELLDAIASAPDSASALAWRPAPSRAHIAWHLMHLAASDDRMLHFRFQGREPADPELVRRFAYQSTPDDDVPTLEEIRDKLQTNRDRVIAFAMTLSDDVLDKLPQPDGKWTYRQALQQLAWHEAHHHGQAHCVLNLLRAAADDS